MKRNGPLPAVELGRDVPPAGSRVYAIGDVHGRRDLLLRMHELIKADADASKAPRKVLVYLGDYVDRGPDSAGVLNLVSEGLSGFEIVRLRGNHEEEMLAVLDGCRDGHQWLSFGGLATLRSYGVSSDRVARSDDLPRLVSEVVTASHQALLRGLSVMHREGGLLFVHAGIRPGKPLEGQDPDDLVWIREPFLNSTTDHGVLVIHGHTIVRRPEVLPNRIGIDTGAYDSDRLTCFVAEGSTACFLVT